MWQPCDDRRADAPDGHRLRTAGLPGVPVGLAVERQAVRLGVKTMSRSCHSDPATRRSLSCAARCSRRPSTSWLGSARVRRLRADFGSSKRALTRHPVHPRRTDSVPRSRSISGDCRPRASDCRSPSAKATVHRAALRICEAAARTRRASSAVSGGLLGPLRARGVDERERCARLCRAALPPSARGSTRDACAGLSRPRGQRRASARTSPQPARAAVCRAAALRCWE